MDDSKKIIVALDFNILNDALALVDNIDPSLCRMKIGKELFTKYGHKAVTEIQNKGFEVFLDLKFHDIPTTVYKACISALSLNIWMLNIHLTGGLDMTLAAMQAKNDCQSSCKLIGVTTLTSLSNDDCLMIYGCSRLEQLKRMKKIGMDGGIDGFVCSPYDIRTLKDSSKVYITPGIRIDSNKQDHHKVISPKEAINLGSSYLVIGRSITKNPNPNNVLNDIIKGL